MPGSDSGLPPGKPSAEAPLHVEFLKRGSSAVLHSHSVWSTVVSERFFGQGCVKLEGFEMLKALEGVTTHETKVEIPIFENTQDMVALAKFIAARLDHGELKHGFMLRGHGLYVWGPSLSAARNHLEAIEFLFEVVGRVGEKS